MWSGTNTPEIVKTLGEMLRRDLDRHDDIRRNLAKVFEATGSTSIHFVLGASEADDYPWEILYDKKEKFVDIRRWPIGRIKNSNNRAIDNEFKSPLRVLAVLAATGPNISADREWEAIRAALTAKGVDFELRAFVCEEALLNKINGVNNSKLTAEWVPESIGEILSCITTWQPRLIHFFCHGGGANDAVLRVGTRGDWTGQRTGRVVVPAHMLAASDAKGFAWLITLNCCDSASGTANYASALVVDGIPNAVGMRRQVANIDAHVFSEALYAELGVLFGAITNSGEPKILEFAPAIAKARYRILEAAGQQYEMDPEDAAFKSVQWMLPVLYNRYDPIKVQNHRPPPSEDIYRSIVRGYFEEELTKRRQQGAGDDDARIQDIQQRIAEMTSSQDHRAIP